VEDLRVLTQPQRIEPRDVNMVADLRTMLVQGLLLITIGDGEADRLQCPGAGR
jgi:hypothetical protein